MAYEFIEADSDGRVLIITMTDPPTRNAISDEMALLKGTKYIPEDRPASLHREHQRILDAIIARDPDQADCAAQDHIENALRVHLRVGRGLGPFL